MDPKRLASFAKPVCVCVCVMAAVATIRLFLSKLYGCGCNAAQGNRYTGPSWPPPHTQSDNIQVLEKKETNGRNNNNKESKKLLGDVGLVVLVTGDTKRGDGLLKRSRFPSEMCC